MLVVLVALKLGRDYHEKANARWYVRPEATVVYPDFDDYAEEVKECAAEDAKTKAVEHP